MFIQGVIVGLLVATFIAVMLTFFRRTIEHRVEITEKYIESKGPRPKGMVIFPEDEDEIARQEIIENNRKQGKDTPIADLLEP